LHSDLQKTAVNAMRENLHQFDERHSYRTSQQQKRPLNSSYNTGSTYPAQVTQINERQLIAKLKDGTEIKLLWKNSPWRNHLIMLKLLPYLALERQKLLLLQESERAAIFY
jgi:penicillin-binding protein 1A